MTNTETKPGENAALSEKAAQSPEIKTELKQTAFDRILLLAASIIFCVVAFLVILQVFTRYVTVYIGVSFPWTEEVARYLLIVVVFLGSAVASRKKEHIVITTLVERFSPKAKLILDFISTFLILGFLTIAIIGTTRLTFQMMVTSVGSLLWLKLGHIYALITLGLAFMMYYHIRWIIYYGATVRKIFFGKGRR
jgi:TRAP-type C4-dicarboxylate transport system permease small subunit